MTVSIKFYLFLLILLSFTSNCATILRHPKERVRIYTNPPEVTVQTKGIKCISPCALFLSRDKEYMLSLKKEGYRPYYMKIRRNFSMKWVLIDTMVSPFVGGASATLTMIITLGTVGPGISGAIYAFTTISFLSGVATVFGADLYSGALYDLNPRDINVTLEKE